MTTSKRILAVPFSLVAMASSSSFAADLLDAPGPGYRKDMSRVGEPVQYISPAEPRPPSVESRTLPKRENLSIRYRSTLESVPSSSGAGLNKEATRGSAR